MSRFSMLAGFAVGASLLVTPVAAHAGWGDGRGRNHRDSGVGTGDVIAGVLVLGAIAAIVSSGNRNSRDDDRRDQRYPEPDYRTRATSSANYQTSRGIDSAVSMCVDQIERGDARVDSVDNAARTTDGWRVSGVLDSGSAWNCWIDNDGRLREVDLAGGAGDYNGSYDGGYAATSAGDGQLSDEAYARARAAQGSAPTVATTYSGSQPAYPGGPLPGEDGYDEAMQLSRAN